LDGPQQENQEREKAERHEERGALEEKDGVDVEQRAQEEVHERGAVLVVPALEEELPRGIGLRLAFLQEHLRECRQDHGEIEDLLGDRVPGVGAVDHGDIEDKAADEGEDRDPLLVLRVVELEALDPPRSGNRFVHFRCFQKSKSLRANTAPRASSSCMKYT